jgi:hypothetical protein
MQVAITDTYILASKIKAGLAMLLYAKISQMTNYVIKSSELGKITNLLASDFGVIEMRMGIFIFGLTFPISAIGCTTLLITRLGWPGVVGVVILAFIVPICNAVSKKNGSLIQ